MAFQDGIYYSTLMSGNVSAAMAYLMQFPEQSYRLVPLQQIFSEEQYISYDIAPKLNSLILVYQQYYRNVFYLHMDIKSSTQQLRNTLAQFLNIHDEYVDLDTMEQNQITAAFSHYGLYFMGGKTDGYYGPYVWKTSEDKHYSVELPDGMQSYTVRMMSGFITKSWLDYVSNGEISTGGWTDKDGVICCDSSAYDLEGEEFQISLLKHEAQHAIDLLRWPNMQSNQLEYRAKLVELIYSTKRNLLIRFLSEADPHQVDNSHAVASYKIISAFKNYMDCDEKALEYLPISQIQKIALCLFQNSKSNED